VIESPLQSPDRDAIVAAIEENLFALAPLFRHLPGAESGAGPEGRWTVTDVAFPFFNSILGTDVDAAGADATIERALRLISVERGHDVREATLVAFGGAGPLHACALADALGAAGVLVPPDAGVLSAWGLLGADERHDASRTVLWRLAADAPWPRAAAAREFRALAAHLLRAHGRDASWRFAASWALRYRGQSFELDVPAGAAGLAAAARDPRAAFARLHERRFGYTRPGEAIEVVDVALSIARPGPRLPATRVPRRTAPGARLAPGLWRREALGRDARIVGPARVVEYGATTWVPAGWRGRIDAHGNLGLERARGGRR